MAINPQPQSPWEQGLPYAIGGLGALGSIFGAIQQSRQASNYQRVLDAHLQNQRRQFEWQQKLMDPQNIARGVQAQYQPLSQEALAALNRNVNTNLGMRGIQFGGAGNLAAARAHAEQENFRRQLASQQYMQSLRAVVGQGRNASGFPNPPPVQGGGFGLGQALTSLGFMQAMRNRGPGGGGVSAPSMGAPPLTWNTRNL